MTDHPSAIGPGRERPPFTPKSLQCPNCGSPLTVQDERARLTVCPACDSRVELTDAEATVLGKASGSAPDFDLELGHEVPLDGHTYEVAARMAWTYEGDDPDDPLLYLYLLYSPRRSSRWISCYDGSWDVTDTTWAVPTTLPPPRSGGMATHDGAAWKHAESGTRILQWVDGALPWVAEQGDRVDYHAYEEVGGDRTFEAEEGRGELDFAVGRRLDRNEVAALLAAGGGIAQDADEPLSDDELGYRRGGLGGLGLIVGIGAVGLVAALVLFVLYSVVTSMGLSNYDRRSMERAGVRLDEHAGFVATCEAAFAEARADHPDYLGRHPRVQDLEAKFLAKKTATEGLAERHRSLMPLTDHWYVSRDDEQAVDDLLREVRTGPRSTWDWCGPLKAELDKIVDFKETFPTYVETIATMRTHLAASSIEPLFDEARAAAETWPKAQAGLTEDLETLTGTKEELRTRLDAFETAAAKSPPAYVPAWQAFMASADLDPALSRQTSTLQADLKALPRRIDRVLTDLKSSGYGSSRKVKAKYLTIVDETATESDWQPIEPSQFKKWKSNVGMVVSHKDRGVLPRDADTTPTPPGWHYVGDPELGRWVKNDKGIETWQWAAPVAFMAATYWGSKQLYRAPTRTQFSAIKASSPKPWYGRGAGGKPLYGTNGTWTKKRFPTSAFILAAARRARRGYNSRSGSSRSRSGSRSRGYGGYGK